MSHGSVGETMFIRTGLILGLVILLVAACSAPTGSNLAVPPRSSSSNPGASAEVQGARVAAQQLAASSIVVAPELRGGPLAQDRQVQLPEGFSIEVIARVPGARSMALAPWGEMLVTQPRDGRIVALQLSEGGGPANPVSYTHLTLPTILRV